MQKQEKIQILRSIVRSENSLSLLALSLICSRFVEKLWQTRSEILSTQQELSFFFGSFNAIYASKNLHIKICIHLKINEDDLNEA